MKVKLLRTRILERGLHFFMRMYLHKKKALYNSCLMHKPANAALNKAYLFLQIIHAL